MRDEKTVVRRRWLSFSLRSMLLLTLGVTLVCGWHVSGERHKRKMIRELRADGFSVITTDATDAYPRWLVDVVGGEYFETVTYIERFHGKPIEAARIEEIAKLGTVEQFRVSLLDVSEEHFVAMAKITTLTRLDLSSPKFDPALLRHLSRLKQLKVIYITQPIGDDGLNVISQFSNLEFLSISSGGLTQKGIQQLAALTLKRLTLRGNMDVSHETAQKLKNVQIDDGSFHRRMRFGE